MDPKPLIIVPTYNEIDNLAPLVAAVREALPQADVLIVDDNSPDGTGALADRLVARDAHLHVLHRPKKEGLAAAYLAGFSWALAQSAPRYDLIFEMDSDFSHPPEALPRMARRAAEADVVLGSRLVPGGRRENATWLRRLVSSAGSCYARAVLNLPYRDLTGGFKCFRREVLEALDFSRVRARGYAFQIELTNLAHQAGFRIVEEPIVFVDRQRGVSKMSWRIMAEALVLVWRMRAAEHPKSRRCRRLAGGLVLLGMLLHVILAAAAPLVPDEAYYWQWSRHLQWSYYDHPPLVAPLIRLSRALAGDTELGVRLGAVLCAGLAVWVCARFISRQAGSWAAGLGLVALAHLAAGFHVLGLVITPDTPQMLFWGLALVAAWGAIERDTVFSWVLAGAAMGLGLLSKYTAVLFPASLFLLLLLSPRLRRRLRHKGFWLALAVALLFTAPIWLWNAQNGWASLRFQTAHAAGVGHEVRWLRNLWQYLASILAVGSPLLVVTGLWALARAWRRFRRQGDDLAGFLFLQVVLVLGLFFVVAFRRRVEPNWPGVAYLSWTMLVGHVFAQEGIGWSRLSRPKRVGLALAAGASAVLLVLVLVAPFAPREYERLAHWWQRQVAGQPAEKVRSLRGSVLGQLTGWKEMAQNAQKLRAALATDGRRVHVAATTYQLASMLAFYLPGRPETFVLRHTERASQYDLWPGPEIKAGEHLLWVTDQEHPDILAHLWRRARWMRVTRWEAPSPGLGRKGRVYYVELCGLDLKDLPLRQGRGWPPFPWGDYGLLGKPAAQWPSSPGKEPGEIPPLPELLE